MLCGGNTLLRGLKERLERAIKALKVWSMSSKWETATYESGTQVL